MNRIIMIEEKQQQYQQAHLPTVDGIPIEPLDTNIHYNTNYKMIR